MHKLHIHPNPCGMVILIAMSVLITGCDVRDRKEVKQKKDAFLEQFDPKLKSIRDQLLAEILKLDEGIQKLESIRRGFTQHAAKRMAEDKINYLGQERLKLANRLAQIEAEAEKGVLFREMNKIQGGGTVPSANQELVTDAERSLKATRNMTSGLERELGGTWKDRAPASQSTRSDLAEKPVKPRAVTYAELMQGRSSENVQPFTREAFRVHSVKHGDYLTVRVTPSASSPSIARIGRSATGIEVVAEPIQNGETLWAPIRFGRVEGYANAAYLTLATSPFAIVIPPGKTADAFLLALQKYPDLQQRGSRMNVQFAALVESHRSRRTNLFQNPQWPIAVADEVNTGNRP